MKKQIMKRAWLIRKEAALKFSCKVSEICFSSCLKMAWKESKVNKMIGSEKQVKRANDIKERIMKEYYEINEDEIEDGEYEAKIYECMKNQNNSKWWIHFKSMFSAEREIEQDLNLI